MNLKKCKLNILSGNFFCTKFKISERYLRYTINLKKIGMKLLKFGSFLLIIMMVFTSCHPDGRMEDDNTLVGTPSNADTVLHHKYHVNKSDTVKWVESNVPQRLRR